MFRNNRWKVTSRQPSGLLVTNLYEQLTYSIVFAVHCALTDLVRAQNVLYAVSVICVPQHEIIAIKTVS